MSAGSVMRRGEPGWPKRLDLLAEPPALLHTEGDVSILERPMCAIIGSRLGSAYGERVAYEAAQELAANGVVIVSGLARGLDARAHRGALDGGGTTVAVLGCGLDLDYPRANRDLRAEIRRRGLVLTEYEPGTAPQDFRFPWRNRIIAALAHALLIVEGNVKGGTSNTAKWAAMVGTPVFCVPGRLGDPLATGPLTLLRDGAEVYLEPADILLRLGLPHARRLPGAVDRGAIRAARAALSGAEASLFDAITSEPQHVDRLAERVPLDAGLLLAALSSLELQGLVTQLPGKHFVLAA
jgi:DNA processing protein